MQTDVKQVFYFNAGATALGGYLGDPRNPKDPLTSIPTTCSVSLSPTGGEVVSEVAGTSGRKEISFKKAYTFASGKPLGINGPWVHRVVSVVEGLNVLGRVKADRLIAQAVIEHPAAGQPQPDRKISFSGSHFDNLQVDGKTITPTVNPTFVPPNQAAADHYDQTAWVTPTIAWPTLSATAKGQFDVLLKDQKLPAWVRARYSWVSAPKTSTQQNPAGYTLCSLVDKIDGLASGPNPGHCFELPEFGRVFLGEAIVYPHAISLAMVRCELGCKVSGQASAASVDSNGTTCPPSFNGNG